MIRVSRAARLLSLHGTPQTPIEGLSMVYTFADAKAQDRHRTQYFRADRVCAQQRRK